MATKQAARVGDPISHGGQVTTGAPNVIHGSSGKAFARVGDQALCALHGTVTITTGSSKNVHGSSGKAYALVGSLCSCGATITDGAPNVEWGE